MNRNRWHSALLVLGLLSGCGEGEQAERSWTMFPAPIVVQDPRLDFAHFVAPEHRDTAMRVFYATTRAPAPETYPERYTRRHGDAARLGVAHVELGPPGWSFADLVASDRQGTGDPLRPARVAAVEEFGTQGSEAADRAFVAATDRQVAASRTGEAVIYLPGYRRTTDGSEVPAQERDPQE